MRFVWDEEKNRANLGKHGLSFHDAVHVFDGPMLVDLDDRFDYGEDRWVGIGRLTSRIVVIVYTEPTDETIRIISVGKALSHEQKIYEEFFGK